MLAGRHKAGRTSTVLPLAVLAFMIGLGCATAGGIASAGTHNDPPNGLRRMLKTLEAGQRAKQCCVLFLCGASMSSDPPREY